MVVTCAMLADDLQKYVVFQFLSLTHRLTAHYTSSSAVAEATRCFMSLNILLSHSRSFQRTLLS